MLQNSLKNKKDDVNLVSALGLVVVIAIILVLLSLIIFIRSDAYKTVKQIQSGVKATAESDLRGYDTTSPVNAENIDDFTSRLNSQLAPIGSENDILKPEVNYGLVGL